ncbi:MAG: ferritin-like domain-containing protein [Sporocytophaga sp.]|uniref:ferritin-like domain-containing protein n=1 Tax=Sporocytophaga sp. TaxID=2231183 RepID=UPI001AFEA2C3|nr:ferritin-like domain-containing protein [Sporocytophaga sp.]MBO9700438.1 ferritin-like domain-containing protein [Sporocytophaga sp.]
MKTSKKWTQHFNINAIQQRVDWNLKPEISETEIASILYSLQAWQLGETSDGAHLLHASTLYANKIGDPDYIDAIKLFIKEEQKHGGNLGRYLDAIDQPRIKKDWGDSLFRKIRYYNTNMEIWTLAVITVESSAQVFYQCLKNATGCALLKQICTDILIDEAYHIDFQTERMSIIFNAKSSFSKFISRIIYPVFFFATSLVVWSAHKKLFKAGGTDFKKYMDKMKYKYFKTLHRITFKEKNKMVLSQQVSL